ncbi:uncharacterized protein LOC128093400 [Culex pipiens pallens]|uniref:uncharacterized protein LOC128093400 n=1 Tax=Culex pipiens pallens TaxID=42434 RepID=UPI0022AA6AA1|nr:uncharacterized protein LOC128093400 [Culex pipiens pallens]
MALTENGKQSQYIINVSPDDEVIIHRGGANDRTSGHEPDQDQTPQDFVQQALRLRDQFKKTSSGAKASTPLPASSFVEYTTVKYDHFGPSRTPPSAAPVHHSKPVQVKAPPPTPPPPPQQAPAQSSAHQPPGNYRPKHMKPRPTKQPVNTVTPYNDLDLPEAEPTSPYRKEKPKDHHKSPKHTQVKQQDTAASSLYIQKVKPIEPVFTSYNTHHDTGSSFKEFQHLPLKDSHGSSSFASVQKVKSPTEVHSKHTPMYYQDDAEEYYEKKHKKHVSSEEIRHRPKHMKPRENYPKAEPENYPAYFQEKIRHTVERHPSKNHKESSSDDPFTKYHYEKPYESTKISNKYEHEASPSIETYRYQPPKSYPPEEMSKFKFHKEVTTTPEPYKPYQHVRSYVEEKPKRFEVPKEEIYRHQPSKHQYYEYSDDKLNAKEPIIKEESFRPIPSKIHSVEVVKPSQQEEVHHHHEILKVGPSHSPKYYEDPSPAPSYAKVTTYPTQGSSSYHRAQSTVDPYKFKPHPTPEISIVSHGFQKPSATNFPKYIPTKMPDFEESGVGYKKAYPSSDPISNYIPSSTQETFSGSSEYPKIFSMAPTTYSPKYPVSPTPDVFDFPHMSESPKSFAKYAEPTMSTKVYGTINPSEQPFKTLSTKIVMKPSPTEISYIHHKETPLQPLQNRTTNVEFKPSPAEDSNTEYYTNPEHTTYYVFANGTEVKIDNDPLKNPPEFRLNPGDTSYLDTNYTVKLAEEVAMKYNWDAVPSPTRDGEFLVGSESMQKDSKPVREYKKSKPIVYKKQPLKAIKTVTIYRNTHRSADETDMEGGFEPSDHYFQQKEIPQISDKKGEVTDDDEDFFFANGEVILQDDPSKASKKNAMYLPPGINNQGQMMIKLAQQQHQLQQMQQLHNQPQLQQHQQQQIQNQQQLQQHIQNQQQSQQQQRQQQQQMQQQIQQMQEQQVPDMDMSAEPSKKHQYFVLYHIEDNKKRPPPPPPTTQAPPTPPPIKQEIHYHYSESNKEDPEVTHEHFNYHHEETVEDLDDDVQHHYIKPNTNKFKYAPNIAHPSYNKYKDSHGSGSETTVRVVDPDTKNTRPVEITKQEYMRHVQNAVMKYMKQLQEAGQLPSLHDRDSDETQKTFEEVDIAALLQGNNAKHKFQLNPAPVKVNLPTNPSQYKPMKTVPSSSSYKTTASSMKIPKNTYSAGKPLKVAIESLQEQLGASVDLTVKGPKATVKPDLSAIDVGQSYLHGPTYEPNVPLKSSSHNFGTPSVVQIPAQKAKLHFNQQTYHDINSLTNVKESQNLKQSSPYSSIKGGTANVGASISFGGGKGHDDDHKLGPEAMDAPIQIINGIPVTNPYNIDINTLRYMLGGLAQAQAEQQQQPLKLQEPSLKIKGSNWLSLPTIASPAQIFSSNMPTFQHQPSEASNFKYSTNFDSSNFKIKAPSKIKDFKMKPLLGADTIGSTSMNYASWGEPIRQNRQVVPQQPHHHQQSQQQQQQQQQQIQHSHQSQTRPNREFNPEAFLQYPHGHFISPVMKKKNAPVENRKIPASKPAPLNRPKSATSLDTNLRPPPPG